MNDMATPGTAVSESVRDASYTREQLTDFILGKGRFLIGERPRVVTNAYNTSLVLFPQDLALDNENHLKEKIRSEMERTASFMDVHQLNALRHIPKHTIDPPWQQWLLTLGMFLYFEDACNAAHSSTTFLSAMREQGAALAPGADVDRDTLLAKTKDALSLAGIATPQNLAMLDEWSNDGSYTIKNTNGDSEKHYFDRDTGENHGTYVKLAEIAAGYGKEPMAFKKALQRGADPGINEAISYAIGNREHMRLSCPLTHAQESVQKYLSATPGSAAENDPNSIPAHIELGQRKREEQLMESAKKAFAPREIAESKDRQMTERQNAQEILKWLPDEALEMLLHSHQSHTHVNAETVASVYPEGGFPGVSQTDSTATNDSIGARDTRFGVLFTSNGKHADSTSPDLTNERVAMTTLHELMHVAIEYLSTEEVVELEKLAEKTSQALRKNDASYSTMSGRNIFSYQWLTEGKSDHKTQILEENSIEQVLDYGSPLYDGYQEQRNPRNPLDTMRKEEVICNLYGMIHTEYRDREDERNPIFHPPEGMEIVREFAEKTDACFKKAVRIARSRNHTDLPEPTHAHTR